MKKEMKKEMKNKRKILILIAMLLFLAMPVTSADINITGIGTQYDGIDHYGYVDYRNIANVNASGAILVFIDGTIVAAKLLNMPIRYVAGFRCSPTKTLEFPLNDTEGNHTILAYTFSRNVSAQRSYGYYAEEWWIEREDNVEEEVEMEEEDTTVKDWLPCCGV
jgi:hypothetical protein